MNDDEKTRLDYERTSQYFFHLAEIRFKLLALLPIATGTAVATVPAHFQPAETLALGILGLAVTTGILLYDQRNSQIYNSLLGRLNVIEAALEFPRLRTSKLLGGAFIDRPGHAGRRLLFRRIPANHGVGLDLIYSASIAAWLFVIAHSGASLLDWNRTVEGWLLFLVPAVLGIVLFRELRRIDKGSKWEGAVPAEVQERIDV